MKQFFIFLIPFLFSIISVFPQNTNPYTMFGYNSEYEYKLPMDKLFRIHNTDTTSPVKTMTIDFEGSLVYFLGEYDAILDTAHVNPDDILIWLSVDPLADKNPSLSPYAYCNNRPTVMKDPDGRDGVLVIFPDYQVDTETMLGKMPLGHAGVLLIDNNTGLTKYYEYGRYPTTDGTKGRVRNVAVSNVVIDPKTGKPTQESLNHVMAQISEKSGQGGRIQGAYVEGDFKKMNDYAQNKFKESNTGYEEYNNKRDSYSLFNNNCGTFAIDVLGQDPQAKKQSPWILDPTPSSIGKEYQRKFPNVDYNPQTKIINSTLYD